MAAVTGTVEEKLCEFGGSLHHFRPELLLFRRRWGLLIPGSFSVIIPDVGQWARVPMIGCDAAHMHTRSGSGSGTPTETVPHGSNSQIDLGFLTHHNRICPARRSSFTPESVSALLLVARSGLTCRAFRIASVRQSRDVSSIGLWRRRCCGDAR